MEIRKLKEGVIVKRQSHVSDKMIDPSLLIKKTCFWSLFGSNVNQNIKAMKWYLEEKFKPLNKIITLL